MWRSWWLVNVNGSTSSLDPHWIWVVGCATGEEAYSVAMLCVEATDWLLDARKVQLFATDIDEGALAHARAGVYTLNDVANVPSERLRRFFVPEGPTTACAATCAR